MPRIFIVILNWNGWKDTLECVESINKLTKGSYSLETIIVDNASTDESIKKLNKYRVVSNSSNLGFAGGNNIGIQLALDEGADWICVLNNDTVVDKNLLVDFLSFLELNLKAGIISPKIYFAKGYEYHKRYKKNELGKVFWYAGGIIDWNNVYGSNFGVDEVDIGQYDQSRPVDFATGACMFLKSSMIRTIGLFDEKFYLYLEDADLSIRARNAGYEVLYAPEPHLWHKVSQSSGIGSDLNDYYITRNRLIFGMRYASLRTKYALARESVRMYFSGRPWQKVGVRDYYSGKLYRGSWGTQ